MRRRDTDGFLLLIRVCAGRKGWSVVKRRRDVPGFRPEGFYASSDEMSIKVIMFLFWCGKKEG